VQGHGRLQDDLISPPISRFEVPDLGVGVGFRVPHYGHVVDQLPPMDWFEVLSENFMVDGGSPLYHLDRLAERYPIVLHGVSMSLGGHEDPEHTRRLVALADRVDARWVSDHVCFTGTPTANSHDLLPVPYTAEMLDHLVERCKRIRGLLDRPFAVENPSTYLSFHASTMPEVEFVATLCERADVGWLLDVNNVFVSAVNHGFDAAAYLDAVPADRIVQIHLAGHSIRDGYRLDTHDGPVSDDVLALYRRVIARVGPIPTLVEWDAEVPPWERLAAEAELVRGVREEAARHAA
jgi:uncharacterized protein (UPF0276 family)